jgi:NodT family efflux transporter outer membrane factor (OMF) lipoprotein
LLVLLSLTALPLIGCAVGPDYVPPVLELPTHWRNAKQTSSSQPALARWWTRFRDGVLDQLIDDAVAGNLDVATAMARVREARANYRQTVAALLPTASGTATVTRSANGGGPGGFSAAGIPSDTNFGDAGSTTNLFSAAFDTTWELDLFGANRRNAEAAWYGTTASEEQLRATLVTLIGDVALNYVNARTHQARIALARNTARAQRETAAVTRSRFEAGAVSAVDLANAEGLANSTEANIPTIEVAYANAVHRIGVLIGRDPGAVVDLMKRGGPIPSPRLPLATGIPADVLQSRPDVRSAERRLAEATAKIGQAEAALYPSVSLTGNITTSGTKIGDLAKGSSIGWSFGPTLTVPIFNAGGLAAAVDAAGARRDQQFLAYRAIVLTALEEVENSLVGLAKDRIRIASLGASVKSYREAASLSRSLYQTGSASFLSVLDAQRSLYAAEDALLQSRLTLAVDYIALNKALGGGWLGRLDVTRKEVEDGYTGPHIPSPWSPAIVHP